MRRAGAYATGVLVLMTSASVAVTLSASAQAQRRRDDRLRHRSRSIFIYTTVVNVIERAGRHQDRRVLHRGDHRHLADLAQSGARPSCGVASVTSMDARPGASSQEAAGGDDCASSPTIRTSATRASTCSRSASSARTSNIPARRAGALPRGRPCGDASEFAPKIRVRGEEIGGLPGAARRRRRRSRMPSPPSCWRSATRPASRPHVYFGWTEGNPLKYLARFIFFGEGDIAPLTHEILRKAEPNPKRRPAIHVG